MSQSLARGVDALVDRMEETLAERLFPLVQFGPSCRQGLYGVLGMAAEDIVLLRLSQSSEPPGLERMMGRMLASVRLALLPVEDDLRGSRSISREEAKRLVDRELWPHIEPLVRDEIERLTLEVAERLRPTRGVRRGPHGTMLDPEDIA